MYARTFTAGKLSNQYCTKHIANELQMNITACRNMQTMVAFTAQWLPGCMQTNWRHNKIITRASLWYYWLHKKKTFDTCISTTEILAHWGPCTFQIANSIIHTCSSEPETQYVYFHFVLLHNIVQMSLGHPVILVWMSFNHPVLLAWRQVSMGVNYTGTPHLLVDW